MSLCVCPICNCEKRNLTKHIIMTHKLSKEEFLLKYPGTKMISEETSSLITESLKTNWEDPDYAKRCSAYWKSERHGQEVSKRLKEVWKDDPDKYGKPFRDYSRSDKGRQVRSQVMKQVTTKLWKDPEYIQNRRNQGRLQMEKNLQNPKYGCYGNRRNYLYNNTYYRSSWEVSLAQYFDSHHINFLYESHRFEYKYQGISHNYIPDFYLNDYDLFIEVKPQSMINELTDIKLNSVLSEGHKIIYLTDCSESGINSQLVPLLSNK